MSSEKTQIQIPPSIHGTYRESASQKVQHQLVTIVDVQRDGNVKREIAIFEYSLKEMELRVFYVKYPFDTCSEIYSANE